MKHLIKLVVVSLICTPASWAAAEIKIGYVDLQQALQTVDAGKKAKSRLEKEVNAKRGALEKEQAALEKEKTDFEKKAAIMNEATRGKKMAELQQRFMELQKKAGQSQMELQQRERELTKPLIDKLRSIIEAIGKERKYQLILEKNEGAVLYAMDNSDLTEEVIKRFDK